MPPVLACAGGRSAGAVSLTDDSLKRRKVALIGGAADAEGLLLLSPTHYLRQALDPVADILGGIVAHGPRVATMQNEYSLLCRLYDLDMAELSVNEDVTLLAYSALGAGLLGGQYKGGTVIPEGSRRSKVPDLGGRVTPRVWAAVEAYRAIAQDAGLDPVTMAIAFTMQRPFKCVPIIGGRSIAQLDPAINAAGVVLDDQVKAKISAAYRAHPMPF